QAPEVVPEHGVRADGHLLVLDELHEGREVVALVQPAVDAHARRSPEGGATVLPPSGSRTADQRASGRGGGPARTRPSRSKRPLWQAHQMTDSPGEYCTVQPSC